MDDQEAAGAQSVTRSVDACIHIQVLLLEAGENHDNDEVIANSADAWIGGCVRGLVMGGKGAGVRLIGCLNDWLAGWLAGRLANWPTD